MTQDENMISLLLEPEQIKRGMEAMKSWYNDHPDKDSYVVVSGPKNCWSPRRIVEVLEEREKTGDWGKNDIPEMLLESISIFGEAGMVLNAGDAYRSGGSQTEVYSSDSSVIRMREGRVVLIQPSPDHSILIKAPPRYNIACIVSLGQVSIKRGLCYLHIRIPDSATIRAACYHTENEGRLEYHVALELLAG